MYRYIYKITCTAGSFKDKFYFGQHTTENMEDGYKGSGKLLLKYYKKYPHDFIKEIISFHDTYDELNEAEEKIVSLWLGHPMCLNLTEGCGRLPDNVIERSAASYTGYKHTDETKELMRQRAAERKKWCEETGNPYFSKSRKGLYHPTEETRQKLSIASKKMWANRPRAEKKSRAKYTPEERSALQAKYIKERNVGAKWMTDGTNEYFVRVELQQEYADKGYVYGRLYHTTGVKFSKESKQKISNSMKGIFAGAKWMNNGTDCRFVQKHLIQEYISNGYVYGRI